MKPKVKEKELQKQILEYLETKNVFHYRNNSGAFKRDGHFYQFGSIGSPDIICVIRGQYVGIEVKGTGGKQSPHQKEFQGRLELAGGKYILAHSWEEFEEQFK